MITTIDLDAFRLAGRERDRLFHKDMEQRWRAIGYAECRNDAAKLAGDLNHWDVHTMVLTLEPKERV